MTLKNNRAPLLHYVKLCAVLQSHWSIQTGVTVRKPSIWAKINVFVPCDLEIWWMTLKNNRAPLLGYFKLCASFHSLQQIQSRVTVWKSPIWVKIDDFFLSRVTFRVLTKISEKSSMTFPWQYPNFQKQSNQNKLFQYFFLQLIYQFTESITDICMDIYVYTWFNKRKPAIQLMLLAIELKVVIEWISQMNKHKKNPKI